ncbi:neprilysin-1-like [Dermacentor albipictus]|uniref:neprilysin-1-like n=1 Tax=Dermacentor albipictus TaxID=60249 RepID=UPI0031FD3AB6
MAPRDTVMPPEPSSTQKQQPDGPEQGDTDSSTDTSPAQPSKGQAPAVQTQVIGGDVAASGTREAHAPIATPAQPQGGDDAVRINALTLAWIWGLLPGGLAGVSIAYVLWSVRKHAVESMAQQCNTSDCRYATELLKSTLDRRFEPCDDFYSFVCSRFSGRAFDVIHSVQLYMRELTESTLLSVDVPLSHQNSTQKAAGLFRACVSMANTTRSEVPALKSFLGLVGLDLSNMPPDPNFNIAERIVRLNFEYGFPTYVKFGCVTTKWQAKKVLTMDTEKDYEPWLKNTAVDFDVYAYFLYEYDSNLDIVQLANHIAVAEGKLLTLIHKLKNVSSDGAITTVGEFGTLTGGVVSKDEWRRLIAKYTGGAYDESDALVVLGHSTEVAKLLVANGAIRRDDARLVLSWRLVRQLLPLSSGAVMATAQGRKFEQACLVTVSGIMEAAVMSSYLRRLVPSPALKAATVLALNVIQVLLDKVQHVPWMEGWMRSLSIKKASKMGLLIGYPKDIDTVRHMEAFFADFPDAGANFFTPWLEAHRLMTQRLFRNDTVNFTSGEVNAFYNPILNTMTIQAGIVQPPFFFALGTAALNYGGLGQIVGHEVMHGYDVNGIRLDPISGTVHTTDSSSMFQYAKRVYCLRQSYIKAEQERAAVTIDDDTDSEGFADFTGLQLAYAAYNRLTPQERLAVVPDVGLSAEQTFFVAHCLKWCDLVTKRMRNSRYWAGRSRCIVPLRNTPEFATAFSCSPGAPMNPPSKCSFWE